MSDATAAASDPFAWYSVAITVFAVGLVVWFVRATGRK